MSPHHAPAVRSPPSRRRRRPTCSLWATWDPDRLRGAVAAPRPSAERRGQALAHPRGGDPGRPRRADRLALRLLAHARRLAHRARARAGGLAAGGARPGAPPGGAPGGGGPARGGSAGGGREALAEGTSQGGPRAAAVRSGQSRRWAVRRRTAAGEEGGGPDRRNNIHTRSAARPGIDVVVAQQPQRHTTPFPASSV